MLEKANIKEVELKKIELNQSDLAKYSFDLVKNIKEEFVTVMDIFASYLLITEDQTKLLFNKELKKEELMDILCWQEQHIRRKKNPKK